MSDNIHLKRTKTTEPLRNSYNYYQIVMGLVGNTYQYFSGPLRASDAVHTGETHVGTVLIYQLLKRGVVPQQGFLGALLSL